MDLLGLAAMAVQHRGGAQPAHQRQRRVHVAVARRLAFGRRRRAQSRSARNFALQAQACHNMGRGRTQDHVIPETLHVPRPSAKGKGQWKTWTPESVLRVAFAKETLSARAVAAQVDGGSAAYALESREFVAEVLDQEQMRGWSRCVAQAEHEGGGRCSYTINNIIFDEAEIEISVEDFGPALWNVLASHSQLTVSAAGKTIDCDIIRPPRAIPTKQAVTMWPILAEGLGGLWPGVSDIQARFKAVLLTCDAASANLKMLRYFSAIAPDDTYILPTLCAQHRNGNIIERVTVLLGILPGCFAIAKTMKAGSAMRSLVKVLEQTVGRVLVIRAEEPPGLQEEWASGRRCAKALLDLD